MFARLVSVVSLLSMISLPVIAAEGSADTGDPTITVKQNGAIWVITGEKATVRLDGTSLAMTVKYGATVWSFSPSVTGDCIAVVDTVKMTLRLADAASITASPWTTGFAKGVAVDLAGFTCDGKKLDCALRLIIALEGIENDLVLTAVPKEGATSIKELRWPGGIVPGSADFTVVPFMQGMLLPANWPKKTYLYDTVSYGRGLYMPWWGHMKGDAALTVILETPDDGGCHFDHPAGGPTTMGPMWLSSLGKLRYPRRLRICFIECGNYVDCAKRYRQYVKRTGHFLPLTAKIARTPNVGKLIGSPVMHTSILIHISPDSHYYSKDKPEENHFYTSFDTRAQELQGLYDRGIHRCYVHLDGWGFHGYDNLHPDYLPPAVDAGGWEGMKRLADTCGKLGYVFALHDQYRDYYYDARNFDIKRAVMMENGERPYVCYWYGGKQTVLCSSFAPQYVRRNHEALKKQGITINGSYLDVFAVVPPDECYDPDHPVTRTECLKYRAESLSIIKDLEGVVSSEEPADWAIPYLDLVHHGPYPLDPGPGEGPAMGIPVPLFNLVYHDALILPWSMGRGNWGIPEKDLGYLHGLLNAGIPYISMEPDKVEFTQVATMTALHKRCALLEMTKHEFLDASKRRQRTTYSDGTTVTVDFDKDTFEISPPVTVNDVIE